MCFRPVLIYILLISFSLTGCIMGELQKENSREAFKIEAILAYSNLGWHELSDAVSGETGTVDAIISDLNIEPVSWISAVAEPNCDAHEKRSAKISVGTRREPPGILNGGKEHWRIVFEPVELSFSVKVKRMDDDVAIVAARGEYIDQMDDWTEDDLRDSFIPGQRRCLDITTSLSLKKGKPVVVACAKLLKKDRYAVVLMRIAR